VPIPDRLPKATLLAIALLILAELAIRLIPTERLLPRAVSGPGVHTDSGLFSVLAMIDARGSADIALVGSSMMREAVNVPQMRETLRTRFHHKLTVGDYSVRGARAEEFGQIAHELLASKRAPKLILVGLSLRDLQALPPERRLQSLTPYWQLDDWLKAVLGKPTSQSPIINHQSSLLALLPTVVSNTFIRHCRLLRHREVLRDLVLHPTRRLPAAELNPITGKAGENFRSLVAEGLVTVKATRKQLARQSRTNSLAMDESALAAIERLVTQSQARGVKVILIEMPIPQVMRKALPRAEYDDFLTRTASLARVKNIPFLQSEDFAKLNFPSKDGYFLDSQHMNSYGNTRFATILATVAARELAAGMKE
jgi:hypothetical protein